MPKTDNSLSRNLKRIGHLDLPGGGQVYVTGGYAYIGHMKPPHGTSIIDVRDPKNPRVVGEIRLDDKRSHSHKARVIGDLMITNVELADHRARKAAESLKSVEDRLRASLDRVPTADEICKELAIARPQLDLVREYAAKPYADGGFRLWDVSNKAKPRLLRHVRTHGIGVHRYDMDAKYAYISTEMEGYVGNILVIYDLVNPEQPQEVSRWWMPGQHLAGGEKPSWQGNRNRLHHALRSGNELWAGAWQAGFRVIDVSDIKAPRTIGGYDYHPAVPVPTHTAMKVPFKVAGRDLAVVADEEHDHKPGKAHAGLWIFDVQDRKAITPLATYSLSEHATPFYEAGRSFGLHQFQEHMSDTRLYCTWFSGGVRVIDIKDPADPVEVAHYIPEPIKGEPAPQTNDIDVDDRGLVYVLDRLWGFDILEVTK